jgi:hypothetical protein
LLKKFIECLYGPGLPALFFGAFLRQALRVVDDGYGSTWQQISVDVMLEILSENNLGRIVRKHSSIHG